MDERLAELRARIDALDDQVLAAVSERARLAQEIGALKGNGTAYRPEREAQVLARLAAHNPGPLPPEAIDRLFRELMSACRSLEAPLSVAFLGPPGTYSEQAALKHFGHAVRACDCASIDEVFRRIEAGEAGYGVVPVENSSEGAVFRTLDLLLQSPLSICGEVLLRIRHQLLRAARDGHGGPGGPESSSAPDGLDGLRRVYSHAQSLAQCQGWLNRHLPGVERVAVVSNAEAARLAGLDPGSAAIAGENAAGIYGLTMVARNLEDEFNNTTRFLVIARHDAKPSGHDKTSFVAAAVNRPGAVVELLAPLAAHQVSMTKLESRPSRLGLWEYVFFVDAEGHRDEPHVNAALEAVRAQASLLKVLGSYPVAGLG